MTAENTLKPLRVPSPTTEEYGDFKVTKEYVTMDEIEREIQAADMVSVVRCRDCKHYNTKLTDEYDGTSWCCIHAGYAFPDDYCSWGERREQ